MLLELRRQVGHNGRLKAVVRPVTLPSAHKIDSTLHSILSMHLHGIAWHHFSLCIYYVDSPWLCQDPSGPILEIQTSKRPGPSIRLGVAVPLI